MEVETDMAEVDTSKLRLMVVDDEADNLDLLYRTFRRGYEVFRAESAIAALQILDDEGEMGVIISDQRMPKMNGTEFLSQVAERFPDTIRILLTGYTDVGDLVDAINSGKVFKYVTKPWQPEALRQVVQQASETYRLVKNRTETLNQSLRRESIFNGVMMAIRESLDYSSMLQTIVATVGESFEADACLLHPIAQTSLAESLGAQAETMGQSVKPSQYAFFAPDTKQVAETIDRTGAGLAVDIRRPTQQVADATVPYIRLVLPLTAQKKTLALLVLYRQAGRSPWSDGDQDLLEAVAGQAALAMSQAQLYHRIQQQTEQMQAELAVARQIQSNLLRQELPQLDHARVQACCRPARAVGGDFFEVYVHPRGELWIGVGDVSGKGVPAALFMASAISVLRRELSQDSPPDPNQVMQNLNSSLMEDLVSSNCFITLALARYTPQTRELVYANAGHIYPCVWNTQTHAKEGAIAAPTYLETRGVPLGILPSWKPANQRSPSDNRLMLTPGSVVMLTSDGVTEATLNTPPAFRGKMLQVSGLWKLLCTQQREHPLDLSKILNHIQSHSSIQEDDQTILSLEVL
jgi:serine phosphatase RsbU (regulator of sigma subunit)/CheY-like chemotaxis protein